MTDNKNEQRKMLMRDAGESLDAALEIIEQVYDDIESDDRIDMLLNICRADIEHAMSLLKRAEN